jgi:TetR/AcrR family transcriptional regulator
MADIAAEVQLPRSNLHYYFTTKSELYSAVLFDLLEVWKQDALCFEMFDDPRVVLSSYIRAKMNHSRSRPYGSKVWANEIIHGAPTLGEALDASLYDWAKMKEAKIRQWVEDKRILPVEPSSLLYMIWASTQHYADFDHQVNILNEHQPLSDMQFERAIQTVTSVILRGIGLEPKSGGRSLRQLLQRSVWELPQARCDLRSHDVIGIARIMVPVQKRLAGVHRHHLDAVRHRAGDLAQVAAHALIIDHFIFMRAVGLLQAGDRLVRGVLAGDVAAPATDAGVLVDLAMT